MPGLAVGVVSAGQEELACVGVTSVSDPLPVDEHTLFFIGSTTKTLTATAVMTCVQQGSVTLDDLVRDVLPELRLSDPSVLSVLTVGMLLDHTAGFRGDTVRHDGWGDDTLERAVATCLPGEPQVLPPGTVASYNNAAVLVAGRLLEVLTRQEFTAAVRERVLDPLGMSTTFFLPWEVSGRRLAGGHVVEDGRPRVLPGWPTGRATGPVGGAVSSLRDQIRWARFCLDGTTEGSAPLEEPRRLLMQQPRITARSTLSGVGVSWLLQQRGDTRLVTHGGNLNNLHVSTFVLAPDLAAAVVVMANSRGGHDVGRSLVDAVLEEHGSPTPAPLPRTAADPDVVGVYDAGAWKQAITERDGRLFMQMVLPPDSAPDLVALFQRPPTELVAVGTDQLALVDRPWDPVGDVGRDADGRVAWLRWGMRVLPAVPAQHS